MENQKPEGKDEYLINELASLAGVTVRTIRYYTEEGLLPQPDVRGKYAYYTRDHLNRLELIKQMKAAYLPLREIRQALQETSDAEVVQRLNQEQPGSKLGRTSEQIAESKSSALDYIARLRSRQEEFGLPQKNREEVAPLRPPFPPAEKLPMGKIEIIRSDHWQRIEIAPGIEIHLREPVDPEIERIIDKFIQESQPRIRKLQRGG